MRLICFGDSWTAGFGIEKENIHQRGHHMLKIGNGFYDKLRINNCWPRWLANELDCPFVTFAKEGYNNTQILDEIKSVVSSNILKNDDIIIVMFSYPYRYASNPIDDFEKIEKLLKPYCHFYFNAFYPMFKNEIYETIPENFIDPNTSMLDMLINYELQNPKAKSVWEYSSTIEFTQEIKNNDIIYHPNMFGYKLIGKHIHEKIKNKKLNSDSIIKNNKFL